MFSTIGVAATPVDFPRVAPFVLEIYFRRRRRIDRWQAAAISARRPLVSETIE
jgi:hypothetical protein